LFVLQPVLKRIVKHITQERPELFNRLNGHHHKQFLIDPTNMPFVFILEPDPEHPVLRAYRRRKVPPTDARIAGSFLTLLDMVDGHLDGDALFFTRALTVEGDTEAIVCLRNALDDMDGSIAEDTAKLFGSIGLTTLNLLRSAR
jgi:predicted lipid carrier protein YhbT